MKGGCFNRMGKHNYYEKYNDCSSNKQRKKYHFEDCNDYSSYKKCDDSYVKVHVDCCDSNKDNTRESAFRATSATNQAVVANSTIQVFYQNEQFDLANEYNTATSRFIPRKDGVYNIIGSVHFQPTVLTTPYQITVSISVNGVSIGPDKESHGAVNVVGITRDNIVETVDILRLNAGDIVEVVATPSIAGQFLAGNGTRFAASRIPSPAN
ncbi:hypothetical protein COF68_27370 [Bacillus toyonensis]|uniref:ABC transporter permease n=3 Tax=Bacillus TaxID=1386 RepID=A0AB36SFD5_9BACI|nr:hypothetical protein [Bacillus toyonensis]MBJ8048015.1 hypothetical protein [Bacillus cereus group sp. N18]PDZ86000.1 hypothetical protein CON93_07755 [Bacillus toyonensis]PEA64083.1 hypothetical protein COO18_25025 [Bacillus toyonensis]PEA69503.1 hypothetical protein COO00_27075 [Bacillus toyonensis]